MSLFASGKVTSRTVINRFLSAFCLVAEFAQKAFLHIRFYFVFLHVDTSMCRFLFRVVCLSMRMLTMYFLCVRVTV